MATQRVAFQVEIDDAGVIQGFKKIGDEADKLGDRGKKTFEMLSKQQKQAREASMLLSNTLGVQVPAGLDKVLAKSQSLGPILASAFEIGVVVAFVAAAISAIAAIYNNWKQSQAELERIYAASSLKISEEAMARSDAALDRNRSLRIQAATALKGELVAIDKQLEEEKFLNRQLMVDAIARNDIQSQIILNNQVVYLEKIAAAERLKVRRQFADQARDAELAAAAVGLKGSAQILAQLDAQLEKINRDASRGVYDGSPETPEKLRVAAKQQASRQIVELVRASQLEERQLYMQTSEMAVAGETQIEVATRNRVNEQLRLFHEQFGALAANDEKRVLAEQTLQNKITDINEQGEIQRKKLRDDFAQATRDVYSESAILALPPWQRANAQIVADFEKQKADLERQRALDFDHQAMYDTRIVALEQLKNAKIIDQNRQMAEQLGADFESAWDDATNGSIGQRILANTKKLFFQIVAQMFLASRSGGGNAAGSLIGSLIFGPGSQSAGVFGGGGGVGGVQGGSAAGSGGAAGLGGLLGLGAGGGVTTPPYFPGSPTAGGYGYGGAPMGSYGGSFGYPDSGSTTGGPSLITSGIGLGGGKGFSGGALAGLLPLAGLGIGSKFGGTLGAVGGAITGLAGAVALGNPAAIAVATKLGLIGPLQALLGPVAGGLVGFGVGQKYGKLAGSLSGAGTGALVGFLTGGPVGAIIGGIVGLLGGIIGGIFGGSKRRKQANALADQVTAEVQKLLVQYKGFQIDSVSALTGLTTLQSDSKQQFDQLKGEGRDVYNSRVIPSISDARKSIEGIEIERQRRQGLVFAPPVFHDGGLIGSQMSPGRARANEVVIMAKRGEYVVNADATAKNLSALEAINSGGSVGGGDTHVHLYPQRVDAQWLRNGGAQEISLALNRFQMEGGK
ncbi:MAG: hypothetical protein JWN45_1812 [Acidobacteriaceae bacterium]|nr:hypothetical protein [Acidobacteriaceae bacterium]